MIGAALSENRMHLVIEQIQAKIINYLQLSVGSLGDSGVRVRPSPDEILREIRDLIDSELARPHLILWKMLQLYPEKQYQIVNVQSDTHRSISHFSRPTPRWRSPCPSTWRSSDYEV